MKEPTDAKQCLIYSMSLIEISLRCIIYVCFLSSQVLGPMHCPTTLNGKTTQYPLPEPSLPLNFTNSTGLRYEAEEVRQCLLKGMVARKVLPEKNTISLF